MSQRAYSVLKIKAVDQEKRIVRGVATTVTPDRDGDVVRPKGAKFSLPLPLLWQHNHTMPIGKVLEVTVTDKEISFTASIAKKGTASWIDEAWNVLTEGLVMGASIGFIPKEAAPLKSGGYEFKEWDWYELSLVTVPANSEATITNVKSLFSPGVAGRVTKHKTQESKMNVKEQIASFEAQLENLKGQQSALMKAASDEGRTLDVAEEESFDNATAEIKSVEKHLERLRAFEETLKSTAEPVPANPTTTVREPRIVTADSRLPKATGFVRYAMALAAAKGNRYEALQYAKRWRDSTPLVERVLKAAVDAGTTTDAQWASTLVDYNTLASEFIELLRPQTIIGRLPAVRRVPFNIRMPSQTGGGTYGWVGEGSAKPVGELALSEVTLRWSKCAGIIVVSDELLRTSNPSAEAVVRDDMINGIAQFLDEQFVDPSVAEVTDVSPASITNGVTPVVASGTDADALRADIGDLWQNFLTANLVPTSGVWIMSNTQAMRISLMRNALGQREFPDITPTGGFLEGYPVVTSESVPTDSNGGLIIFVNQRDVFLADDGGVTLDASREASLQMNTTPDNPTTASTVMVSLWQRNLVGIRAERYINWKKRRSAAVGYIDNTNYGAS